MIESIAVILVSVMAISFTTSMPQAMQEVQGPMYKIEYTDNDLNKDTEYITSDDENTEYVASSGDVKIPKYVFNFFIKSMKLQEEGYLVQMGMDEEDVVEYWNEGEKGKKNIDILKEAAMKSVEEFYTLIVTADKAGIKVDKAKINETKQQINMQVTDMTENGVSGEQAFIKETGVTSKQMKLISHDLLKVQAYQEKIFKESEPTSEEIKTYYDENIEDYKTATVQHILISTTETTTEDEEKVAHAKAKEILAKVVANGDMKKLAEEFSDDPGSQDNSGEYTFTKGYMVKEFEDWAFSAKAGDTGIVKTDYGYHVMKFIKRENESLKDASEKINSYLTNEKSSETIRKTIEKNKLNWVYNEKIYNSIITF